MKTNTNTAENGSTIIVVMTTILIVSAIGANVLMNCTTRYNATAKQVKGWKEALYAAEAGGDIGYAECRKIVGSASTMFAAANGWTEDTAAVDPTFTKSIPPFGRNGDLWSTVTVDRFTVVNGNPYYRIRAVGTARVTGLKRVSMDNRMSATTKGDSLLRKIDFQVDHFKATYGFGDAMKDAAETTQNGKGFTAVAAPQVSRRVELIAVPIMPFEGAVKALNSFNGPGSAGVIDSYDSENGAYPGVAAAQNPSHPYHADAREGNVAVNTGNFNQGNIIYGNVSTNGGNITHTNSQITGVIDNAVAFTIPPHLQPSLPAGATYESQNSGTVINPPTRYETDDGVTRKTEFWYLWSGNFENVTMNPVMDGSTPVETVYNIIVNGNVGSNNRSITVNKGVTAKIHFTGNLNSKANDLVNNNVDGPGAATGVKMVNPNRDSNPATSDSYIASSTTSRAGHMQFYGISPAGNGSQVIDIGPPGDIWAIFYAPSATLQMRGNPDIFGAVVAKTFSGNGNTGFHFDKALAGVGTPVEYRVAHYVEDVR